MEKIIVSRHPATIQWLQDYWTSNCPVISGNVTAEAVRGKVAFGNLPMKLAAECGEYWAVELPDNCPRGEELSLQYLEDNARVVRYYVSNEAPSYERDKKAAELQEKLNAAKELLHQLMPTNSERKVGDWTVRARNSRNFTGVEMWQGPETPEETALARLKKELGL